MDEVTGSIPVWSTKAKHLPNSRCFALVEAGAMKFSSGDEKIFLATKRKAEAYFREYAKWRATLMVAGQGRERVR